MNVLNKRMKLIRTKIDKAKKYDVDDAISLLQKLSTTKFIESVDVAINLGIDTRKSDQNIRGAVMLPHGTGRSILIAVFTQGLNARAALEAGAEQVGMDDLAEKIKEEKINFDVVIASPDAMHIVSQIGQILGPRGLMPNPKSGTVTTNIAETIRNIKAGQIRYRNDRNGIVHVTIGKVDFSAEKLKENLEALVISLKKERPSQVKGVYIKKINISTTMGGGIEINQNSLSIIKN